MRPQAALTALQGQIRQRGYDAYLVPRGDMFFGEEVRPCDDRLKLISGFDGSAGLALVRETGKSTLLVDGRYTLQARAQVDPDQWRVIEGRLTDLEIKHWSVAYDPWLFTGDQFAGLWGKVELEPEPENLVDVIWQDRPEAASAPTTPLLFNLSGQESSAKRGEMTAACEGRALLITQPDALAWLMNWRGSDLRLSPLALAFGVLEASGKVHTYGPNAREDLLARLGKGKVQYDPCLLYTSPSPRDA